MNNRELAHRWYNQTKTSGSASNFFYDGPSIYSYGRHFQIASLVPAGSVGLKRGAPGPCVLLTTRSYSISTTKHKNYVRGAIASGAVVFYVPAVDEGVSAITENCAYYLAEIKRRQDDLMKTRKYAENCERSLKSSIAEAALYKEYFKCPAAFVRAVGLWQKRAAAGTLLNDKDRAALAARMASARKATAEKHERDAARFAALYAEKMAELDQWTAGAPGVQAPSMPWNAPQKPPIKLRIKGAAVETSRGAVVSCRAALVLWHAIKAGKDIAGATIEGYTVKSLNGTLEIGCHSIERAEVDRIGALLELRAADMATRGDAETEAPEAKTE